LRAERFLSFLSFIFLELDARFLYLSKAFSAYPEITLFLLNLDDLYSDLELDYLSYFPEACCLDFCKNDFSLSCEGAVFAC